MREDWRRALKLTSPDEAVKRMFEILNVKPKIEEVNVTESLGRVLAEDIVAAHDIPPYDCACFEGYALRSEDTANASRDNPVKLKVIGKVLLDTKELPHIDKGQAAFLVTGAPMPPGADALVKVEETRLEDGHIPVSYTHLTLPTN